MEEALEDTGTSESEHYEVEEIVSHKKTGNGYEYLLKWKGYSSSENTWQSEEDLDCPDLVAAYWKKDEVNGVTKSPRNEKKSTPPKVTKPDKQAPKDTEKKQRKRQPKPKSQELEVLAVAMKNGELHFLCKDGGKQIVKSNKVMKSKHPQELFAFYEKHIEFDAPIQQNKC